MYPDLFSLEDTVKKIVTEVDLLTVIVDELPKLSRDAAHRVVAYAVRLLQDLHGVTYVPDR